MWSGGSTRETAAAGPGALGKGDVVDVEVREVRGDQRLP
jgi:hypothetical protein